MKNLKLILALVISIVALSCGNDDDGGESNEFMLTASNLEGTYNLTFIETTDITVTTVSGGTVTTTTESVGETFGESNIVFNANGIFTTDFQYVIVETTTLENNEPEEDSFIVTGADSGSFTVNTTNQTITIDGELFDVTLFDSNSLRIVSEDVEVNGDESSTFTSELRFTRQ